MWFAHKAWKNVTQTIISNCFKKSGFYNDESEIQPQLNPTDLDCNWSTVCNCLNAEETVSFEDFVHFDDGFNYHRNNDRCGHN